MSSPKSSRDSPASHVSQEGAESNETTASANPGPLNEQYEMFDEPDRRFFLDKLITYMEERGDPIVTCPRISKQPVDLYGLYFTVKEMGGYDEAAKNRMFKEVGGLIGCGSSSGAAYTLRILYRKYLLPYECKFDRGGIEPDTLESVLQSNSSRRKGIKRVAEENLQWKESKTDFSANQVVNFSGPPSLQNIALVSIAVRLWSGYSGQDIEKRFEQIRNKKPGFIQDQLSMSYNFPSLLTGSKEEYLRLEEEVKEKVKKCFLPDALQKKISSVIRPIGLQISRLISMTDDCYKNCSIYWTVEGTIDYVRVLNELISNKPVNNDEEENLNDWLKACRYCSEEYISKLWAKIPPNKKSLYENANHYEDHIIAYWIAVQKNELPYLLLKLHQNHRSISDVNTSIAENMILLSLHTGNVYALKHFWHMLTDSEKYSSLKKFLPSALKMLSCRKILSEFLFLSYDVYVDIVCFLLSHLTDESQQSEIFQAHSKTILESLFYSWPSQRFFLPAIVSMFDYLTADTYVDLMSNISQEIKEGGTAHQIFKDVWYASPLKLKKYFLQRLRTWTTRTVPDLLNLGDIDFVYAMLNDAYAEEKKQIMFNLTHCLVFSDNVTLIDALVSKTLSSENDLYTFRQKVILSQCKLCDNSRDNFQKVEAFLSWAFESLYKLGDFKKNCNLIFHPMRMYLKLVLWGNYEHVNRFLSWYFLTEGEINEFKKSLLSKRNNYLLKRFLHSLSEQGKDGWDLFEKFIDYSHYSCEEIIEFKDLTIKFVEKIVCQNHLEFATLFLNWCLKSADEVHQFKHNLLFSQAIIDALVHSVIHESNNYNKLKSTFKWFSPFTGEIISKLKSAFTPLLVNTNLCNYCDGPCWRQNSKKLLFHLLDTLVEENSSSECENFSNVEHNLASILKEILRDPLDLYESETDSDME